MAPAHPGWWFDCVDPSSPMLDLAAQQLESAGRQTVRRCTTALCRAQRPGGLKAYVSAGFSLCAA